MKTIKLSFVFIFLGALIKPTYSNVYIDTIYVYWANYGIDSSRVYCVTQSRFPNSPCSIENITMTNSLDTTNINVCIADGPATVTCWRQDTFDLGNKPNGSLTVNVTFSTTNDHCTSYLQSKTKQVSEYITYTGFDSHYLDNEISYIILSPRKIHGNSVLTEHALMRLYSTNGEALREAFLDLSNFEIDISTLPVGLYFLSLQNEKRKMVKRFAKQ